MASPMDLDPQQNSANNHSKPTSSKNSATDNPTSRLGKRSSSRFDPFATFVDVSSLRGFKKQKCLKSTISAPHQSCSCMSIDQTKGDKTTNLSTNRS